ncbi:hypothetical protein DFP73DRAFT_488285 [Morchella snyderi]|nr:hypothetical protein DFP73DRAFT_488285 [Morchella snyderi]
MLVSNLFAFLALTLTAVSASPLAVRQTTASGNDGSGDQDVGNKGQNSGNAAANKGAVKGDYTVEQGVQTCGNAQLNCCNKVEKKGDTTNAGLLGSVFGSGDLGVQCTPINLPAVIGAQVPVNKACDAKAACCQGDTVQNGLVNVGCLAIASLI